MAVSAIPEVLTARQAQVLRFIAQHICDRQRPPTRAEIGRYLGASSANCHVNALAAKGYVESSGPGRLRHVRIARWPDGVLPILKLTRG